MFLWWASRSASQTKDIARQTLGIFLVKQKAFSLAIMQTCTRQTFFTYFLAFIQGSGVLSSLTRLNLSVCC